MCNQDRFLHREVIDLKNRKRNAHGMGSFTENPNGSVTHRKSVGYKANGNRKVITVTASSKSACIKKMKEKETAWRKQQESFGISAAKTVVELCQMHLDYQVQAGELKPKSIDRRECTINQIANYPFGRFQLGVVTISDVDDFISTLIVEKVYSFSSIEKILDVINASYRWALVRGDINMNPVEPIKISLKKRIQKLNKRSSIESDVDVLSEEERQRFEATAKEICKSGMSKYPSGVYGLFLLHTGMRVGEMLALRWNDIDLSNKTININKSRSMTKNRSGNEGEYNYVMHEGTTKNEKARKIEMTDAALLDLKAIYSSRKNVEPDDFVVITRKGKPHTTSSIEHRMETIYRNAGLTHLKGGVHILRKTFATEMYENGARVKEISAYIGDLESTTQRYYIAIRKKKQINGREEHIVSLPTKK